jgi:hypothetical protein
MVVPFDLTSAPATFMCLMNSLFNKYLDKIVLVFLDGILIYSKNEEECEGHLRLVLQVIREHKLYEKLSKSYFFSFIGKHGSTHVDAGQSLLDSNR